MQPTNVRFNFYKTNGRTNAKLGAINHLLRVNVIKGVSDFMMPYSKIIFLKFRFLDEEKPIFFKREPTSDLQKCHPSGGVR